MPFKNPINSAWVDFRDNVFEYHEGELTMEDVRTGFFCGATVAFSAMVKCAANDDDMLQQLLEAFAAELEAYRDKIIEAVDKEML